MRVLRSMKSILILTTLIFAKVSYAQDTSRGFNLIVLPPEMISSQMIRDQVHATILRYVVDQNRVKVIIDPTVVESSHDALDEPENTQIHMFVLEFYGNRDESTGLYALRASLYDRQSSIIMKTTGRRGVEERHVIHTTREILDELFWGDGDLIFEDFEDSVDEAQDSRHSESVSSLEDTETSDEESESAKEDSIAEESVAEEVFDDEVADEEEEEDIPEMLADQVEEDEEVREREIFRSPIVDLRRDEPRFVQPTRQVFTNTSASVFFTREVVESDSLILVENDIQRLNFKGDASLSIEGRENQSLVANITFGSVLDSRDFEIKGSRTFGLDFRYDIPSIFTSFQLGLSYDSRPFINLLNPGEGLQSWDTNVTWLMARIRLRYDIIGFLWSEFRVGVGRSFMGRTEFNRSGDSADVEASQFYFEFSQNVWRDYYLDFGVKNITVNSSTGTEFLNDSNLLSLGLSYRGW